MFDNLKGVPGKDELHHIQW